MEAKGGRGGAAEGGGGEGRTCLNEQRVRWRRRLAGGGRRARRHGLHEAKRAECGELGRRRERARLGERGDEARLEAEVERGEARRRGEQRGDALGGEALGSREKVPIGSQSGGIGSHVYEVISRQPGARRSPCTRRV